MQRAIYSYGLRVTTGFPIEDRDIRESEWIDNFEESDAGCHSSEGNGWS